MIAQPSAPASAAPPATAWTTLAWRSAVVAALVAATIFACLSRQGSDRKSEAGVVMKLPERVASFTGKSEEMSEPERLILPKDTELTRMRYTNPAGDEIVQTIVLSGGEKRSIHRPEICLPGQGWTISDQKVLPVKLKSGRMMDVMNLTLTREVVAPNGSRHIIRGYFMYWFVGSERTTASQVQRFLITAWDRLRFNVNHRWAYVIVSGLVEDSIKPGGKNAEETLEMAKEFIRDSVPYFQKAEMPATASPDAGT